MLWFLLGVQRDALDNKLLPVPDTVLDSFHNVGDSLVWLRERFLPCVLLCICAAPLYVRSQLVALALCAPRAVHLQLFAPLFAAHYESLVAQRNDDFAL